MLWMIDVISVQASGWEADAGAWWLLAPGVVAAVALLLSDSHVPLHWRAGVAAVVSGALTLSRPFDTGTAFAGWGMLETLCLLLLLVRVVREVAGPWRAVALSAALASAVIAAPFRLNDFHSALLFAFLLTFLAGGALGLGCYVRALDHRRRRAVADVRQSERLALARELHDFVAHHVTGIVVQAQAARTVREIAPEQMDELLHGIERAGSETLESMRKLVRVLREDDAAAVRPGELCTELAELVAAFSERDAPATLQFAADARQLRPGPEVETSVRNVVREALTNVRRHAPGTPSVTVRVTAPGTGTATDGSGLLRVEVRNAPPERQQTPSAEPLGGRGGLGLVGLTERTEALGGTLRASRDEDGGWTVTAELPLGAAVTGSPA
ncbi:hypothetical protein AN216_20950 [Streptomyces oceani]|uniref:histidine kinase n=1 Tax=Streptomyces oceani TaxID=1075402 RepID=A0A1E7JXM9_9ACTN|nr:hypothetical protein AN216_20950 [Streptomyces oceani]